MAHTYPTKLIQYCPFCGNGSEHVGNGAIQCIEKRSCGRRFRVVEPPAVTPYHQKKIKEEVVNEL